MIKKFFLYSLAAFMIFAGVNHFIKTDFYLSMMPPYLPFHLELVYLSGVAEIICGALLLVPELLLQGCKDSRHSLHSTTCYYVRTAHCLAQVAPISDAGGRLHFWFPTLQ